MQQREYAHEACDPVRDRLRFALDRGVQPVARIFYFSSFVSRGIRPSRSCLSANKRLISVTSSKSFLGSYSTDAYRHNSVQCAWSFMAGLMPPEFLQTALEPEVSCRMPES